MVRLHVVYHKIVYRTLADGLLYIGQELFLKSALDSVNERDLLICNNI